MNAQSISSEFGPLTREEANQVAREHGPGARIERRRDGGFRAVFDHVINQQTKRERVCRPLIAQIHATVSPAAWDAIDGPLTQEQADSLRAELEPQLPKKWRVPENWFVDGSVFVCRVTKGRAVTSHC